MEKIIQDVWILNDSGIVLFSRVFDETVDEQLFGGFMTALNSFAGEISEGGLSSFELANKKFTIRKENRFLFVVNSAKDVKTKKVEKELNRIVEKFFDKYSGILDTWDNDINVFKDFKGDIENSLQDTLKKMEEAFW
ncbi:MAG: hypothetical protein ACOC4M_04420 [Promethearchaeia archaeon]